MGFQFSDADTIEQGRGTMIALKKHLSVMAAMLALSFVAYAPAYAQTQTQSKDVEINADRFVVNEGSSEATFSGNVVVTQPDLTIWANKVVVHYGKNGPSDLKDFEAIGNVKIKQPEQTATGERAIYDPKTKILRLRGNVVVTSASGTVRGPELIVNIASGISEFSSGSGGGRVTGVFTQQQ